MTTTDLPQSVDNNHHPVGHGRMLRKEDPRFVRGLGTFCDDVTLPGMLHLAIRRRPRRSPRCERS
jgi:aerobic carbon-monoxide dehydrogenase large subunit